MRFLRRLLLYLVISSGLHACGGGEGGAAIDLMPKNVINIRVDKGITGDYINGLFAKITICPVASDNCAEVDNILVDTGSTGLRIIASAIPGNINIDYMSPDGSSTAECTQFVSGVMWGPIASVDVKIGREFAGNIPIQLIGVDGFNAAPSDCSSKGQFQNTVQALSANGVLGISNFTNDCGAFCANNKANSYYYTCDQKGCLNNTLIEAKQVQNPVAHFDTNNNGTIIYLPNISSRGATAVDGKLIFGIDTDSNNRLDDAKKITLNPNTANFSTVYKNHDYPLSYFDSGTNGIYFDDNSIKQCTGVGYEGYYCSSQDIAIDVIFKGVGQELHEYAFKGSDAVSLLKNPQFLPVQPNLIGSSSGSFQDFVWGLPFFYGKYFFTAIENRNLTVNGIFCAYR